LTATSYKYLDIGISVGRVLCRNRHWR